MSYLDIYKASAGSGKTFKLTSEYLKLLFSQNGKFNNILAVTFTNKATTEMQDRILQELYKLSTNKKSDHINILLDTLSINENEIRKNAGVYLQQILHNYSQFNVSTIDSFFQNVLKTFTREIGLNNGFNVELNSEMVIQKAVEQLLSDVKEKGETLKWLENYAFERMKDGKSWDIHKNLIDFSKIGLNEVFLSFSNEELGAFSFNSIDAFNKELNNIINGFINYVNKKATEFCQQIEKHGLSVNDFTYNHGGVAGYFSKIKTTIPSKFYLYGERVLDAAKSDDYCSGWATKKSTIKEQIKACVQDGLQKITVEFVEFVEKNNEAFFTALAVKQNINLLALFIEIYKNILQYSSDNNLFLLLLSSPLLNKMIDQQDAPFIYEKTGQFLQHFMIDEFQDTSQVQWQNFAPLVSNSLSQANKSLIVGDVKQAIYRWRNGNWELLAKGVKKEFEGFKPTEQNLEYNWRSSKNIVVFNNLFFKQSSKIIQQYNKEYLNNDETTDNAALNIEEIYKECEQKIPETNKGTKGYVQVKFIEEEKGEKEYAERFEYLHNAILELAEKGYQPKDIAILVRKKDKGQLVAEYLMEQSKLDPENADMYRFVSSESVFLNASNAVCLIVLLMNWIYKPNNMVTKAQIVHFYTFLVHGVDKATEILKSIDLNDDDAFLSLFPNEFTTQLPYLKQYTLSNIAHELIRIFFIENACVKHQLQNNMPFIQMFQDVVFDFSNNYGNDMENFMEWWEDKGKNISINLSEEQNAMRIMTIHKSKGLEFKAVIVPFANWEFLSRKQKQLIWCNINAEPFNKFKVLPINYNNNLQNTLLKDEYNQEYIKQIIDNLNLLYVAFTRACNVLYVFTKKTKPQKKDKYKFNNIEKVLDITINSITTNKTDNYNPEQDVFEWGEMPKIKQDAAKEQMQETENYKLSKNYKKLKIKMEGKEIVENLDGVNINKTKGSIYHKIFEYINTTDDVEVAVNKVIQIGLIDSNNKAEIVNQIKKFMDNEHAKQWFTDNWTVKNERSILLENGETKRPDRVIENQNSIVVIDYKFTNTPKKQYEKQVSEYVNVIKTMSEKNIIGYIWYVNLNKIQKIN